MLYAICMRLSIIKNIFPLIAISFSLTFCNSHKSEPGKIEKSELYKFYKVSRLPNELIVDTNSLSNIENAKLKSYLDSNHIGYFINERGDFYLRKDPIQNDIVIQFWILTDDALNR